MKAEDQEKQRNLLLKAKVLLQGGHLDTNGELPLDIENRFLENVIAYEEADYKPIHRIIGVDPADFPPPEELTEQKIREKLDFLAERLTEHNIVPEYQKGVPDHLVYQAILEALHDEIKELPMGTWHLDGCSGDCPSCFQADYCPSKDEIWEEEEFRQAREKWLEEQKRKKK